MQKHDSEHWTNVRVKKTNLRFEVGNRFISDKWHYKTAIMVLSEMSKAVRIFPGETDVKKFDCGHCVAHTSTNNYASLGAHIYAIILSLIYFQSFCRRFTIRKFRIKYTKDFHKRKFHFI